MRCLAIASLLLAVSAANADLIIGNYPQTNDTSTSAGLTTLRRKALGFIMPNADYFLDSVTVRLQFTATGLAATPVLNIHAAGTATAPGAVLFTIADPGNHVLGAGDYTFTAGSQFTLMANTKYWISIAGLDATSGMDWRGSSPAITPTGLATHEGSLFTSNGGTSWSSSATLNTYQLNGTLVPEPASLAMLGLGVAAFMRRRVKKKVQV